MSNNNRRVLGRRMAKELNEEQIEAIAGANRHPCPPGTITFGLDPDDPSLFTCVNGRPGDFVA